MTDATQPTASPASDDQSGKQIWDPALRAFHWLLALSVVAAIICNLVLTLNHKPGRYQIA